MPLADTNEIGQELGKSVRVGPMPNGNFVRIPTLAQSKTTAVAVLFVRPILTGQQNDEGKSTLNRSVRQRCSPRMTGLSPNLRLACMGTDPQIAHALRCI